MQIFTYVVFCLVEGSRNLSLKKAVCFRLGINGKSMRWVLEVNSVVVFSIWFSLSVLNTLALWRKFLTEKFVSRIGVCSVDAVSDVHVWTRQASLESEFYVKTVHFQLTVCCSLVGFLWYCGRCLFNFRVHLSELPGIAVVQASRDLKLTPFKVKTHFCLMTAGDCIFQMNTLLSQSLNKQQADKHIMHDELIFGTKI